MSETTRPVGSADEIRELAHAYGQAWNDHDLEAILALHTDDVVFRRHGSGGTKESVGIEACRETYAYLLGAMPDQHFEIQHLIVREDFYATESLFTATVATEWNIAGRTFDAIGTKVSVEILDMMELENGLIKSKNSWIDGAAIREQLEPGG